MLAYQEGEICRLRLALEDWKLILLPIKDVLLWKQQWHPFAIIGGTTVLFTLLWLLEPSILTILSLIGLFLTICDYIGPSFLSTILRCNEWNTHNEKEFDEICTNLVIYYTKCELFSLSYFELRQTKPKLFYILTVAMLSTLSYIGCVVNNLFLAYVIISGLLLLPGVERNGATKNLCQIYGLIDALKMNVKGQLNSAKKEN